MFEKVGIAEHTSVDGRSFCSEACQFWLEHVPDKLVGPRVEVEIDETVISRRKYNRRRFGSSVALNGFPRRRLWCH